MELMYAAAAASGGANRDSRGGAAEGEVRRKW